MAIFFFNMITLFIEIEEIADKITRDFDETCFSKMEEKKPNIVSDATNYIYGSCDSWTTKWLGE